MTQAEEGEQTDWVQKVKDKEPNPAFLRREISQN